MYFLVQSIYKVRLRKFGMIKMKTHKNQAGLLMRKKVTGFTLTETLIAVAVASLVLVALAGIWISSVNYGVMARNRTQVVENQLPAVSVMIEKDIMESTLLDKQSVGYATAIAGYKSYRIVVLGKNFGPSGMPGGTLEKNIKQSYAPEGGSVVSYCLVVNKDNTNTPVGNDYKIVRREVYFPPAANLDYSSSPHILACPHPSTMGGTTVNEEILADHLVLDSEPVFNFSDGLELYTFSIPLRLQDSDGVFILGGEYEIDAPVFRDKTYI